MQRRYRTVAPIAAILGTVVAAFALAAGHAAAPAHTRRMTHGVRHSLITNPLVCARPARPFAVGAGPPGCWRPYSPGSPFNQPLPRHPRLAANSAAIVRRVLSFGPPRPLTAGEAGTNEDYDHPGYYPQPTDPWFRIHCTEPWGRCSVEGMWVQIPNAARPAAGGDGHMAVVDQLNGWEYDFWRVEHKPSGGGVISVAWGGRTPLGGNGLGGSATATDFALQAGIIRAQEMQSGTINHALFMTVDCTTGNSVYPAQGCGTACPNPTNAPAGGMRFQLNYSDAQIAALRVPAWKKTILRALAHYGAFIGDTRGTGLGFEFESGSTYTSFGYADQMVRFARTQHVGVQIWDGVHFFDPASGVNWSRLRVIAPCVTAGSC